MEGGVVELGGWWSLKLGAWKARGKLAVGAVGGIGKGDLSRVTDK